MTWFEIWHAYQLDCIRRVQAEICSCHDAANLATLGERLGGLCRYYDNNMRDFQTLSPADVERLCHDDMVHHWQLLRIAFMPELRQLAA